LVAEGGSFNGCTIAGIGTDKLEQILYRVVTQYYSSSASFNSGYYNWIQAAADLYGADSPECLQTRRALQSVELDQPGYCSGLPARLPAALDPVGW
jgi:Zn-dependent metalloprotease